METLALCSEPVCLVVAMRKEYLLAAFFTPANRAFAFSSLSESLSCETFHFFFKF